MYRLLLGCEVSLCWTFITSGPWKRRTVRCENSFYQYILLLITSTSECQNKGILEPSRAPALTTYNLSKRGLCVTRVTRLARTTTLS